MVVVGLEEAPVGLEVLVVDLEVVKVDMALAEVMALVPVGMLSIVEVGTVRQNDTTEPTI